MHLQCTMSSIFDWEVRRLGMRITLKHGTITISGFGYFHKNCRFLWKKVSKTNWGSTTHYTYTSYNKYFRLVWFQRCCDSMKSVFSFSSIDRLNSNNAYMLSMKEQTTLTNWYEWTLSFDKHSVLMIKFISFS